MTARRAALLAAGATCLGASGAAAGDADYYRGGWRTDSGDPHVYEFVIKGERVSGITCTHCADGTTLARVEGTFDEETGIDFAIRHLGPDGTLQSEDRARAALRDGALVVSGTRGADGAAFEHVTIKDPRGPVAATFPVLVNPPGFPQPPVLERGEAVAVDPPVDYEQPAPWLQLTADDVAGVWLGFGVGLAKQYFIIRKDGDELFGLVCGRCDNPFTFGALDDFEIHGDTLEFDIVHQDWGDRAIPFERHVTAHITMNELRMASTRRDDDPAPQPGEPAGPAVNASLYGPLPIEATAGNVVSE